MFKKIFFSGILLSFICCVNSILTPVIEYCPYDQTTVLEYYKNNKVVKRKKGILKCTQKKIKKNNQFNNDYYNIINNTHIWNNLPYIDGKKCITSNNKILTISMGLVIDYNLNKHWNKHLFYYIEQLWKRINYIFVNQFGFNFIIKRLVVEKNHNNKWSNPWCMFNIFQDHSNFYNFPRDTHQAVWHRLLYCPNDKINAVGVANNIISCKKGGSFAVSNIGRSNFMTVAHEIGHTLSAPHHHDANGIMAPSASYLNNIAQFNKLSKPSICNAIKSLERCNNKKAYYVLNKCGNGIIEPGEECECKKNKICKCCKNCKLIGECNPIYNECCSSNCHYFYSNQKCSFLNKEGYCRNGYCEIPNKCNIFNEKKYCGIHYDNPCKIMCKHDNRCLKMTGITSNGEPVNWVMNGTLCLSNKKIGYCKKGFCIL